jgi:hypothetical protein
MDVFDLAVLERTLELVSDTMPLDQDPAVAGAVNVIRRSMESPNTQDQAELHSGILQLARLANENRQFLIAARLEAFAREMKQGGGSHDVA